MSTVESFQTELMAMQSLLQQQSAIVSSADLKQLHAVQCEAFVQKMITISHISVATILNLTSIIGAGSWTEEQKGRLTMGLNASLVSGPSAPIADSARRKSQEITSFHHWTIQEEAAVLQAPGVAFTAKIQVACNMMRRMGLVGASERSKGHIMKVLLASCTDFMNTLTADQAWSHYQDLKRKILLEFKNNKSPGLMGYIINYPDRPSNLPTSQLDVIFNGQSPVTVCSDARAFSDADELLAMRGNSSKLTVNKKTMAQQPLQLHVPNQQQQLMVHLQQLANTMMPMMRQTQGSNAQFAGDVPVFMFPGAGGAQSHMGGSANGLSRKRSMQDAESSAVDNAGLAGQQLALADASPGQHVQGQLAPSCQLALTGPPADAVTTPKNT